MNHRATNGTAELIALQLASLNGAIRRGRGRLRRHEAAHGGSEEKHRPGDEITLWPGPLSPEVEKLLMGVVDTIMVGRVSPAALASRFAAVSQAYVADGPAERAGREFDEAAGKAAEHLEKAREDFQQAAKKTTRKAAKPRVQVLNGE